jgi:hypothetical protein
VAGHITVNIFPKFAVWDSPLPPPPQAFGTKAACDEFRVSSVGFLKPSEASKWCWQTLLHPNQCKVPAEWMLNEGVRFWVVMLYVSWPLWDLPNFMCGALVTVSPVVKASYLEIDDCLHYWRRVRTPGIIAPLPLYLYTVLCRWGKERRFMSLDIHVPVSCLTIQSLADSLRTTRLNIKKNSKWCSLCFECFVRISEQTAAFGMNIINCYRK